jgi:hypothetical protein
MPKPVKKPAKKTSGRAKHPSADPNKRAGQMMAEHMANMTEGKWGGSTVVGNGNITPDTPGPSVIDTAAIIKAHMSALGSKGGKISGAKRMEMPISERRRVAIAGAKARWAKKKS